MFNLIVAVISIALIVIIAIATIYYGGVAFTKSGDKAAVATLVNGAQQISGAAAIYKTDTGLDISTAKLSDGTLTPEYLTSLPAAPAIATGSWTVSNGYVYHALDAANIDIAAVCKNIVDAKGVCVDDTGAVVASPYATATTFAFHL